MDIFRLVKIVIYVVSTLIISISCSTPLPSKLDVYEYDDTPTIINSPRIKGEPPSGMNYGKVVPPIFPDSMRIENNLLRQVAAYNSAMIHGDVNTCGKYLYPDAFDYCKKFYPNFPDEKLLKELMLSASSEFQAAIKKWNEHGIDTEIIVYNLERKITYNNDIIIVFNITTNICSDDLYTYSIGIDKTIGISQNGGTNFWFMGDHTDLPTILGMHYPQSVINKVMGY